MNGFSKFVFYNVIVYGVYVIIDKIFSLLHLYSHKMETSGFSLSSMPSSSDMSLIIINSTISAILGYFIFRRFKEFVEGDD